MPSVPMIGVVTPVGLLPTFKLCRPSRLARFAPEPAAHRRRRHGSLRRETGCASADARFVPEPAVLKAIPCRGGGATAADAAAEMRLAARTAAHGRKGMRTVGGLGLARGDEIEYRQCGGWRAVGGSSDGAVPSPFFARQVYLLPFPFSLQAASYLHVCW
ncbi:hypothetical protein ACP70R_043423 [Stipagrostis hirtigluma subsp. patula]